jgi:hypothetical protein
MKPIQVLIFVALIVFCSGAVLAAAPATTPFSRALDEAIKNQQTVKGKQYQEGVGVAMRGVMLSGMRECLPRDITRSAGFKIVFFVAPDGRVQQIVQERRDPVADCFARKIKAATFPPPPRSGWAVLFGIQ